MATKLTVPKIDALKPRDKTYFEWDEVVHGLAVRVTPNNAESYVVQYRIGVGRGAPARRHTLGKCNAIRLTDARTRARDFVEAGRRGEDLKRKLEQNHDTVGAVIDDYVENREQMGKKAATVRDYRAHAQSLPAAFRRIQATDVNHQDVERLRKRFGHQPASFNRELAVIRAAFKHARMPDPTLGVERLDEVRAPHSSELIRPRSLEVK